MDLCSIMFSPRSGKVNQLDTLTDKAGRLATSAQCSIDEPRVTCTPLVPSTLCKGSGELALSDIFWELTHIGSSFTTRS